MKFDERDGSDDAMIRNVTSNVVLLVWLEIWRRREWWRWWWLSLARLRVKVPEETVKAAHLPEIQLWFNIEKERELDLTAIWEICSEPSKRADYSGSTVFVPGYTHNLLLISYGDHRTGDMLLPVCLRHLDSLSKADLQYKYFHGIIADLALFVMAGWLCDFYHYVVFSLLHFWNLYAKIQWLRGVCRAPSCWQLKFCKVIALTVD